MKKLIFITLFIMYNFSFGYTKVDLSNAEFLVQKGIITAQISDVNYRLDDQITRAEVIGIALKIK